MPALIEMEDAPRSSKTFTVLSEKVDLDIDFASRLVKGKAEIIIQPCVKDMRTIRLNCRQLIPTSVFVEGYSAKHSYGNLYQRLRLYMSTGIYQYHFPKERLERHKNGLEDELTIQLPPKVHVEDLDPLSAVAQDTLLGGSSRRDGAGAAPALETPIVRIAEDGGLYQPMKVEIEYIIPQFRDGWQFAGIGDGDSRYPHLYSRNSPFPGTACCLFPCLDDNSTRCMWEFSIRCPRTLGDMFSKNSAATTDLNGHPITNGNITDDHPKSAPKADSVIDGDEDSMGLTEEEKSLEISVVCSGDMTDDIVDPNDPTRRTVSFMCAVPVLPQHIGFAIGPFEHVDLSDFRDTEDDERLGSNAIRVHGFCLPGRADEVVNSCMMFARALDKFTDRYMTYPFTSYKVCFVDDLADDIANSASLSICSTRLLFPETIWEPLENVTRTLIHALASQWIGINVIPQDPQDWWIIVGGSWFMTDLFLRDLFGKNDYKYRQKLMSDKVVQLDNKRASIFTTGRHLGLDPAEKEFMELKAPLVLSILHHRLVKQSGKNGVDRCFWKLFLNARAGKVPNGAISTDAFFDICEKVGHQKLETFFNQWVYGTGCPLFECHPSFNKKKLVVQLTIRQIQSDATLRPEEEFITSSDFMRQAKEHSHGVLQELVQTAFVGPMTIRIHEADGTPYEHIVDINSAITKVEIPYNTKYKRLKRSRRQKERAAAAQGLDISGDAQDDVLLYCLGDVLQSEEEVAEWRLSDWSKEDEDKMAQESYEWLRIDADFEWICKTHISDMPSYMYVSQLQQDKDIVAQVESIQYLSLKAGHPLISSILVRTLMDQRYFHGIRTLAASVIAASATEDLGWIGFFHLEKAFQELFCLPGSPMTRPNDFTDRSMYLIQCAIPRAIASIKDNSGKAPMHVKRFLIDKLRYNENRGNEYSDDYYVATLMSCLAQCLTTTRGTTNFEYSFEDEADEIEFQRKALEELGRLQRVDEWIPSFQNVYTTTAMDCSLTLMKNRVLPRKASDFMQYVRAGNADNVRLTAWNCLVDLGMMKSPAVLNFMLHSIASEPSPYYRSQLLRIFGKALGQVALGELKDLEKADEADSGLIIEQEDGPSSREAELTRKKSIEGALAALKGEFGEWEPLKNALENALRSETTGVTDVEELLEICELLYEPDDELKIMMKLPRYWNVEHLGNGKVRFYHSRNIRSKPKPPLVISKAGSAKPNIKFTFGKPAQVEKPKRPQPVVNKNAQEQQALYRQPSPLSNEFVNDNITLSPPTIKVAEARPPLQRAPSSSQTIKAATPTIKAATPTLISSSPVASTKPNGRTGKKSKIVKFKVNKDHLARVARNSPSLQSHNIQAAAAAIQPVASPSPAPITVKPASPSVPATVNGANGIASIAQPPVSAASIGAESRKRQSPFADEPNGQPPAKKQASEEAIRPTPVSKPSLKIKLKMKGLGGGS